MPAAAERARPAAEPPVRRRTPATLLAFRFGVIYLGLFALATQITGSMLPNLSFSYRGLGRLWPMREITHQVAASLFGVTTRLDDTSGGEPPFFWIQTLWILVVSILAAGVWSAVARGRHEHVGLYAWFRLLVRLALAAALFEYGMTKVIPTQFPAPPLTTLVTPVGDLTLSALLWTSVGAAPPYQIVTGIVELLAGVLLLAPRTAALGAAIAFGALLQVFALNLFYDIGLKVVTFHLIVLALIVLAPSIPALIDFFVRQRPGVPRPEPPIVRTAPAQRALLVAQLVFGAYLLGMYAYINAGFWETGGGGRPRSAFYGIWNVEALAVDGEVRPAETNDYDRRWRRVIFDEPDRLVVQRTDDSLATYGAAIDAARNVVTLTKGNGRTWGATFTVARPSGNRLTLSGEMDGRHVDARLRRVDPAELALLNSTFRWMRTHAP